MLKVIGVVLDAAVRVTDFCNHRCKYCYARVDCPQCMQISTVAKVLAELASISEQDVIKISWTGGEPMLMGVDYFRQIVDMQKSMGRKFSNTMQTNLSLLTPEFTDFLAEEEFKVRTSLDLPIENHNQLRKGADHEVVLKNIKFLQEAGVQINVNTVLTSRNIMLAKDIFEFLKANKIQSFSVSRCLAQGMALQAPELLVEESRLYGDFLNTMFDLWMNDQQHPLLHTLTPLDNLLAACQKHLGIIEDAPACFHCQSQMVAVSTDGSFYPSCNKFLCLPNTRFGNINEMSLSSALASREFKSYTEVVDQMKELFCKTCPYFKICQGGCYFVSFNQAADADKFNGREQFCKGYHFVFKHILAYLKEKKLTQIIRNM